MLEVIFSFDDGCKEDLITAKLLKEYGIPAIFFIPNTTELTEQQISGLAKDFEIGGHTYSHPEDIKLLPADLLKIEIEDNKEWLESIVGYKLRWFAYPSGRHNELVREAVKNAGFQYARTTLVNCSAPLDLQDSLQIKTTFHLRDRKEYGGRNWFESILSFMKNIDKDKDYLLHIFGHSWEIEKNCDWVNFGLLVSELENYKKI